MAGRARQRLRGRRDAVELLARQQQEPIDIGLAAMPGPREQRALRADDERAAVVGDQLLALKELLRWELAAVVPHHGDRRLAPACGELQLQDAPERCRLFCRGIRQRWR